MEGISTPRFNYAQESPIERAAPTWTIENWRERRGLEPVNYYLTGNQSGLIEKEFRGVLLVRFNLRMR